MPDSAAPSTALSSGRPRTFDEGLALAAALELFRRQGYEATSLDDLTRAMGIGRSSFYACFGSKRAVLLRALSAYSARALAVLETLAGEPDPLPRLVGAIAAAGDGPHGCLMVNCISELAPHDEDVAGLSRRHLDRMAEILASTLPDTAGRQDRASALCALALGLLTLRKSGVAEPQIAAALAAGLVHLLPETSERNPA